MPKIGYYGVFSLFHRCRASARLPSQKQKSIRTLCIFGAEQFKTRRFLLEQGIKSMPYCRMARFLTQFKRKYTVLNHIGFGSPHLMRKSPPARNIFVILSRQAKNLVSYIFILCYWRSFASLRMTNRDLWGNTRNGCTVP